jgi:peptidoglycan/LPS O-acetylase OafA/YrhL
MSLASCPRNSPHDTADAGDNQATENNDLAAPNGRSPATANARPPGPRNRRIDLIRGVSILLVLFHHFNIAYHLNDTPLAEAFGPAAIQAVARNGNYGVTMFFVISGYLITSNANRRWPSLANIDASTFYILRIARILPCLLLLLAAVNLLALTGLAIFQNHIQSGEPPSFWLANLASLTFWMNVLIGRDGWFNYPLGVLWSLSVEEVFYLAFPILCLLLRRDSRLLAFWAAIIVAGPVYRLAHQGDEAAFLYAYLASFDGIAIGCCTALLANHLRLPNRLRLPNYLRLPGWTKRLLPFATTTGMACLYLWRPIGQTNVLGVTAMALGTAVLLLSAHSQPTGPTPNRLRTLAMLTWCGKHSYELYLFHLVVLGALREAFPPRDTTANAKLLLLLLFLALSAAISATIARCYAEPLNRRIRRILPRRAIEVPPWFRAIG